MDTLANTRRRKEKLYLGYAGRRVAADNARPAAPSAEGEIFITHDGVRLILRDIHPDDFEALQRGFASLTAQEVRYRFLHPITELPEALARNLCDIDREYAVALVLIDPPDRSPHAMGRSPSATGRSPSAPEAMDGREGPAEAMDGRERPTGSSPSATGRSPSAAEAVDGRERPTGRSPSAPAPEAMDGREGPPEAMDGRERPTGAKEPEIHAVARAFIDPVTLSAEFALVVQQQLAGHGVGTLLMQRLMAACRALGATELWGDVLAENGAMLELCEHLGFGRRPAFDDPGVIRVTRPL